MQLPRRLARSTPYLLTRAVRDAARLAQARFADQPLRFPHYVVACWLDELGPCPQARLARALDADASDLVTVLEDLEAAGTITRTRDESDRRRMLCALTDEGRAWLATRDAAARAYDAELCRALPDSGRELRAALADMLGITSRTS